VIITGKRKDVLTIVLMEKFGRVRELKRIKDLALCVMDMELLSNLSE